MRAKKVALFRTVAAVMERKLLVSLTERTAGAVIECKVLAT